MTWVKVCGIREMSALQAAFEAGADAVGFVIAPGSPREVDLATATELHSRSPLPTFLVSVDLGVDEALGALDTTGADGIQPHGMSQIEVAAMALELGRNVLLPIPVADDGPTAEPNSVPPGAIPLFDTKALQAHGGTGMVFDWNLVAGIDREFVLAGGLGVDNVAQAIRAVRPFGVDASSRLEVAPGVKDPDTIRTFVRKAKQA
mgnify:CR=1 FL=1